MTISAPPFSSLSLFIDRWRNERGVCYKIVIDRRPIGRPSDVRTEWRNMTEWSEGGRRASIGQKKLTDDRDRRSSFEPSFLPSFPPFLYGGIDDRVEWTPEGQTRRPSARPFIVVMPFFLCRRSVGRSSPHSAPIVLCLPACLPALPLFLYLSIFLSFHLSFYADHIQSHHITS